jgi:hypothetical protein
MAKAVILALGLALSCAACVSSEAERPATPRPLQPKASHQPRIEGSSSTRASSDTVRRQAHLEFDAYLQCALNNARKLAASPEPAEQVARAAMASCIPQQQAFTLAIARASDPLFANRLWETTQPDIRRILVKHVLERRQFTANLGQG